MINTYIQDYDRPSLPVLDKGFVRLVDHMGNDMSIVRAARVSYGQGSKGEQEDHKLVNYMMKHRHSSPFESVVFTFHVKAPIFVFRQWHRHRTWCVAGDTKITCLSPRGTVYHRTIKEIYDLKYGGVVDVLRRVKNGYQESGSPAFREQRLTIPWRTRVLPNCQDRVLRVLDEVDRVFTSAKMVDVMKSGVKELWRVTAFSSGGKLYSVEGSRDHLFFTHEGWKKLSEIIIGDRLAVCSPIAMSERPIPPILRNGIGVWTTMMRSRLIEQIDVCRSCGGIFKFDDLELDHIVPVSVNLDRSLSISNLQSLCIPCHRAKTDIEQPNRTAQMGNGLRWVLVKTLPVFTREEETYDISVNGPHHNFMANGIVVHNSYNELSARYAVMKDEFYIPAEWRAQDLKNKQSSVEAVFTGHQTDAYKGALAQSDMTYKQLMYEGVSREMARMVLPVSLYSEMYATVNLHNLFHFLRLRIAKDAQWEIQEYSRGLLKLIEPVVPWAVEAWKVNCNNSELRSDSVQDSTKAPS